MPSPRFYTILKYALGRSFGDHHGSMVVKGEDTMKCNVGGADRFERIFHGIVFLLISLFMVHGIWSYILGVYGAARLLTGIFAFCPVYIPLRYTTWRNK